MFSKILKWHKQGLWTQERVGNAVEKGLITEEQYTEITGEEYEDLLS